MIINLEEKLSGQEPVTKKELIELISSWGRFDSFDLEINNHIEEVEQCKSNECYDLSNLDVSEIDDLSYVFRESPYNGDLSKWDVSNCINMNRMFSYSEFNNNSISNWNVSNVENMENMFHYSIFNGDLSNWNTSKVINIESMFENSYFNNNSLKDWDTSKVINMCDMFYHSQFNGNISNWDVSNCNSFKRMFEGSHFDGNISKWLFKQNIDCVEMFYGNKNFEKKYNNGHNLPTRTNELLKWLEENREKMIELNQGTREEILDFFSFNNKQEINLNI